MMQFHDLRVCDILDFAAENHGDVDIVSWQGGDARITHGYAQIHARARRLAAALTGLGFGRGHRIATLAWNHHRHMELYYGVPGMGGVIHTLNPRIAPAQLAYMIDVAQDRALIFDSDFAPLVAQILSHADTQPQLIELADTPGVRGALSYEALLADVSGAFDWVKGAETEPFGLCFTSGTTGPPKGVEYTHRSTVLHAMACCMREGQSIASTDTILPVVPMFHANAWGMPHSAPMAGARMVMPGRYLDGASLLDMIAAERVTFLGGVPTIWQGILDTADARGVDLAPLRRAGIGGAPPSREMIARIERAGAEVFHAWGMTETNPFGGTGFLNARQRDLPPDMQREIKLGQGRAIFGLKRRIVDDDGVTLPNDGATPGRLLVQGNWVVDRYINIADSPLDDGWFDTGDIATIDRDGQMRIVDRAKDMIKSGGEWMSSIALEAVAQSVPGVLHVAALGRPDEKWGERPVLAVSLHPDVTVEEADILSVMRASLVRWQVPDAVYVLDALPLTAAGKIDKRALRQTLFSTTR